MRNIILFCLAYGCLTAGAVMVPNGAYIKDLENLLNSVESRDPSRPQLTLKLADALFNEALELSGHPDLSVGQSQRIEADRHKAMSLYESSLVGLNHSFALPTGAAKAKIQFQLARLNSDMGNSAKAEQLWQELSKQDALTEVQRESLLRLAEILENRSGHGDLEAAEKNYKQALTLCSSQDVCSYTHYRLAWVYQRQERLSEAVQEMDLALWDSKGQIREESLRDMISFLGGAQDDGKNSLSKIETLSAKIKRPQVVNDLAEAYFAHGNRVAGVYVLETVNRKAPTLRGYVRLMEEDYGFRNWTQFATELDGASELAAKTAGLKEDLENEKILRRLTVQLDGERASNPQASEQFKKTVLLYLVLYPTRKERGQMIDGWLNAEKEDSVKMGQLKAWIDEEHAAGRVKEELRLRKVRAAVAQKLQDYPVIVSEMDALRGLAQDKAEKREYGYQMAYAEYKNKDYVKALPEFITLAALDGNAPDKWAIQSENLALDILGQKKDYAAVVEQAKLWTADKRYASWVQSEKEHHDELADIQKVEISARFEWATVQGKTPEALAVFRDDCMQNILSPKSCANAQVLAVQLGDQKSLIAILQKLGKKDELAAELEASAEFAQAAHLLETDLLAKGPLSQRDALKVALLYELGEQAAQRDRVLKQMITRIGHNSMGAEEDLILQTMKDVDLITPATLKMAWKKENHVYLVDLLAQRGQATPEMRAELIKSCQDMGPAWRKISLSELQTLDGKQRAIQFHGKNSKRRFEARVAAMKTLADRGNCYLQSTTSEQRVMIATLLSRSERELADEIKASPIPDEVDEEGKASLTKALAEMAQPFVAKAEELQKLAEAQLEKVDNPETREALKVKISAQNDSLYAIDAAAPSKPAKLQMTEPKSADVMKRAIAELHQNPNQSSSLTDLKTYYEANGNPRLAAYFQGRLLQLKGEIKQ